MLQLIHSLGYKIDFEMYSDNFFRSEISESETAFFINLKGNLLCLRTSCVEGYMYKKRFLIPHFEIIPTQILHSKYLTLQEETPWLST